MATEVCNPSESPTLTSLVSGIVGDIQDLVKQQLRLTRKEIEADLHKTRESASLAILGWVITLGGVLGLCLTSAHLIHWLGLPPGGDLSRVPLWASFAIASAAFLIVGGFVLMAGKKKMDAMGTPLHDTVQALKEDVEWKTKTSPS
jgi:hypothetical protein